jgi:hypothetical protein
MLRIEYIPDREMIEVDPVKKIVFEFEDDVTMEELASVFSRVAVSMTFDPDLVRECIYCKFMSIEES